MRTKLVPTVIVFLLACPAFSHMESGRDYQAHIGFARDLFHRPSTLPHPLFHLALLTLTGGDLQNTADGMVVFLMAAALAARTWLVAGMFQSERFGTIAVTTLCLVVTLAMPLPTWWGAPLPFGQPSPNIWHNPTYIFAAPLALWLFLEGVELLNRPTPPRAAVTGVVMALSLLAKPNYVLAFVPIFGPMLLAALWQRVRGKEVSLLSTAGVLLLAFGPATVVLAGQSALLDRTYPVWYEPFKIWRALSPNIPCSILLGIAFPLCVLVCWIRSANADRSLILAWATFAVAVATYASMCEFTDHGSNWGWGTHFTASVLYVVSLVFLLRQPADWRRWFCLGVLVCHAASGTIFLVDILSHPVKY